MIKSFKHKGLERFFKTGDKSGIQATHAKRLRLQLTALNYAETPQQMDIAGWDLHPLSHDLKNHYEPNSISEIVPAKDEPEKLSSFNFTEERFERLVRQAYDQEKISISRAAEMLNLSAEEMRERVAEWL